MTKGYTRSGIASWWKQILVIPLVLILFQFLVLGIGMTLDARIASAPPLVGSPIPFRSPACFLVTGLALGTVEIPTYRFLMRHFAKRTPDELGKTGSVKETALGVLLGAGLVSLPMLILWLTGNWHLYSLNFSPKILPGLGIGLMACVFEELLLRGILLRLLDQLWGFVPALILSSVIFATLHLANPGMTIPGILALAVAAGPLLGAAYLWKRRLWFPIGLHFGWNAMQATFWGVNVSGTGRETGVLNGKFSGSPCLTGGSVGIEGSVITVIVGIIAAVIILHYRMKPGAKPVSSAVSSPAVSP